MWFVGRVLSIVRGLQPEKGRGIVFQPGYLVPDKAGGPACSGCSLFPRQEGVHESGMWMITTGSGTRPKAARIAHSSMHLPMYWRPPYGRLLCRKRFHNI